jgi:D-alanyl-D-alanine carboxypeptidase (penicillin-binding protein 5/6)
MYIYVVYSLILSIFAVTLFSFNPVSGSLDSGKFYSYFQQDNKGKVLGAEEAQGQTKDPEIIGAGKLAVNEIKPVEIASTSTATSTLINAPQEEDKKIVTPVKKESPATLEISAASAIVKDAKTGKILFGKDIDKELPVASITKLMTVLVFLDQNPDWEKAYTIKAKDMVQGGKIYLFPGDVVKNKDLLAFSLVGSDNVATEALVSSSGLKAEDFIKKMNAKAQALGLINTNFADPVGLSEQSVSTASEISRLIEEAMSKDRIKIALSSESYQFTTVNKKKKIIYNTDDLLKIFSDKKEDIKILGGKTGYTNSAGGCFAAKFSQDNGKEIVSIVLGSENQNTRFKETENLVRWTYSNYKWE